MTTNHISPTRPQVRPEPREEPVDRQRAVAVRTFPLLAGVAGAGIALVGLLSLSAVAVVGWFLSDAGAHGDTRDALRVAADAWLVGHGSHLTYAGVAYTVVPVGLTLLLAAALWRAARWAVGVCAPADDRETAYGVAMLTVSYVVIAVGATVLAGTDAASPSLLGTVVGSVLLAGLVGGASVLRATGRWGLLTDRLPGETDAVVRVAGLAARLVLAVLLAGVATVLVSLALHAGSVSAVLTAQDLSIGDLLMLGLLSLVLLPNAALLAVGYLAGPGFAVGTGTSVSTGAVLLGPVPAFPLLGALPGSGAAPWWTDALLALPPLVAVLVVVRRHRRSPVGSLDWRHALAAGVLAGVVLGVLSGLGGGALGDGRMSQVGTSPLLVALFLALSLGAGGLLGGATAPLLSRVLDVVGLRHPEVDETSVDEAEPEASVSPALAARLRQAAVQRTDRPASRPPFAPAATERGDDEETVSLDE